MTIQDLIDRAKREEWLTVQELAALTRRDPQTIYRNIKAGKVPGVNKIGGSIRIHRVTAIGHFRRCEVALSIDRGTTTQC